MTRAVLGLGLALLLQACSVAMTVPVSRFDSPEVTGQIGRFRVSGGYGSAIDAYLTSDYTVTYPDAVSTSLKWKQSLGFINAQAGLMPWLDVAYKSFNYVQAKAQFMGRPELDAGAGNLSGAFTMAYGYETESEASNELFGSGTAAYKLNQHIIDSALIMGYRTSDWLMIYGGPYVKWIGYDGHGKVYASSAIVPYAGNGRLLGVNGGVRMTKLGQPTFIGLSIYLELGYYEFKAGGSRANGASLGSSFEFQI